ncbi:MAG TPA: hypothetical protein VK638_34925, partial [Edaphobacter sp.]|nr:hypothetical protein [Edaphobacter sp.]
MQRANEEVAGGGWDVAGWDIAQLYVGGSWKRAGKEWFWDGRSAPECKVLATHGICHDLKGQILPGDPQAGELSDCNWGGMRRN